MLESKRIYLRSYTLEDSDAVHEYASIPEVSEYQEWGPNSNNDTKNYLEECIAKTNHDPIYDYELAICLKENDKLIGGCKLWRVTEKSSVLELGYVINPKYQKQGLAQEATKLLIDFGFNNLHASIIYATCDTNNIPSYKVMEKSGMKRVGVIKNHKEFKGHKRDSYRYEITK
tara:strand:- start:5907 stop:6425 length:519 start_codon:yes stop_codon:yes gene_type:complete